MIYLERRVERLSSRLKGPYLSTCLTSFIEIYYSFQELSSSLREGSFWYVSSSDILSKEIFCPIIFNFRISWISETSLNYTFLIFTETSLFFLSAVFLVLCWLCFPNSVITPPISSIFLCYCSSCAIFWVNPSITLVAILVLWLFFWIICISWLIWLLVALSSLIIYW